MKTNHQLVLVLLLVVALIGGCALPAPAPAVPQADNTAAPQEAETTPDEAGEAPLPVTSSLEGRWEGAISVMGAQLAIVATFTQDGDVLTGTIDIPQQGASGIELNQVTFDDPAVFFTMLSGPQMATFEGELQDDGSIAGTFTQSGIEGTFDLRPATEEQATEETTAEEPTPASAESLPYTEEEVTFGHGTGDEAVTLAGTLTLPEGEGPHPAVILFTGSGQQNRNEELPTMVPGYRPFADIADYLARRGVAVLRYDDRGVGGSTGELATATTANFAEDAQAAFDFLMQREAIDPEQIGLFGHSEGGMIATILAAQNPHVDFVILMAGPGESGYEVVLDQAVLVAESSGTSGEALETLRQQQTQVLDAVVSDEGWDEVEAMILQATKDQLAQLPAEQQEQLGDLDAFAQQMVSQQIAQLQSPWYRFFIAYDPAEDLAQIDVPVLAIFGGLDVQVPAESNAEALQAALAEAGNEDVTVEIIPNANHLFQAAETGGVNEYSTLAPELVPGFLEMIGDWLLARVDVAD